MRPLKPPKDYSEQIKHLKDQHGLVIENDTQAIAILSRVNYYRLSAYGIGLKRSDNREIFIDGISLDHIYSLYQFDSSLRTLLIPVIESLEIELRATIAHRLAMQYGSEGYRNPAFFSTKFNGKGNSIYQDTMDRFDKEVSVQANLPCVKHHISEYGGHFPIWAAIELFSFGMLSSLYSVMLLDDRKEVATHFQTEPKHLQSWMLSLVEVRNICAHYGRIYNMPLKQAPFLYKENKKFTSNKLFPLLITIRRMTDGNETWTTFLNSLIELVRKHPEANLSYMGFPPDWISILE